MASGGDTKGYVYLSFDGVDGNPLYVSNYTIFITLGTIQTFPSINKIGLGTFLGWYTADGTKVDENTSSMRPIYDFTNMGNNYYKLSLYSKWEYEDVAVSAEVLHQTAIAIREKFGVSTEFTPVQFAEAIKNDGVI